MKESSPSFRQLAAASAISVALIALSSCTTTGLKPDPAPEEQRARPSQADAAAGSQVPDTTSSGVPGAADLAHAYAAVDDGGFHIPAVPYKKMNPTLLRQEVAAPFNEKPGTVVVDTSARYLYFIEPGGKAIRYGVGIGRQGFAWTGEGVIQWKQQWPKWFPPKEMIARMPQLEPYSAKNGGMPPGVTNALGSRAMYIFRDGKDTLYRLHGTQEWNSIGKAVSSGCVRILNQDVIDLYSRVKPGAAIKVI